MAKKDAEKLDQDDLEQVEAGATGLPTGKRQHKPLTSTDTADQTDADTTFDTGSTATITYTGLE